MDLQPFSADWQKKVKALATIGGKHPELAHACREAIHTLTTYTGGARTGHVDIKSVQAVYEARGKLAAVITYLVNRHGMGLLEAKKEIERIAEAGGWYLPTK